VSVKSAHPATSRELIKPGRLLTVANTLSIARLALLPFILYVLALDNWVYAQMAFLLMAAAFATDALDGWLARRLNQVSLFGEFLDPIVDKAYTLSIALFLIVFRGFPLSIAAFIIIRALLIVVLGYVMVRSGRGFPRSNWLGKLTGCIYGATALAYAIGLPFSMWFALASFVIALISGVYYLIYFQQSMGEREH